MAGAVTVTQSQLFYVGELEIPTSGTDTLTLNTDGSYSGTASFLGDTPVPGIYSVPACTSGPRTVNINATEGSSLITSLSGNFRGSPITFPATNLPNVTGAGTLIIGLSMNIPSTLPELNPGDVTMTITATCN